MRLFKKRYYDELLVSSGSAVTAIPLRKRGRLLTLGNIDEDVQKFIRGMRKAGTPINSTNILAAARSIIVSKDHTLLVEYGGHVKLSKN